MSLCVYLSGPMSGVADHNFPLFNEVAAALRARGITVENPAENFQGKTDLPRAEYMRADFARLVHVATAPGFDCRGIVLLPGWEKSKGAKIEVEMAREMGLTLFDWDGQCAVDHVDTPAGEGILDEAMRITSGVRQQNYGKPETNHNRIALLWAAWDVCAWGDDGEIAATLAGMRDISDLRCADRGLDVAMKMILLKIAREANAPKRDNLVDIAGYARVISRIHGYEE